MKRIVIVVFLLIILSGCGVQETFETVKDVYAPLPSQEPASVEFLLPEDAAAPVFHNDGGKLYFCDGYEIMVDTLEAGDLNRTVRTLTGYDADSLAILQTGSNQSKRYEFVWTAAGEGGDQVGRTVILDDGNYHYCISFFALANDAGSLQETWQEIASSFQLSS